MTDVSRTVEAVWRISRRGSWPVLARTLRDVGLAEEVAQEAFVAALEQWPARGVPDNPGAWLTTVARRRAVDLVRRERTRDEKYARLAAELAVPGGRGGPTAHPADGRAVLVGSVPAPDAVVEDPVGDDLLALVLVACHPVLPRESRVALTLRLVGGLSTDEIARAFLVPSATVGQRISRAKRTLAEANVPFAVPQADELAARFRPRWRSCTSSSPRATPRRRATRGCGASSPTTRCASGVCSPASPGRARGARARRAHGAPGVPVRRAHRDGRRAGAPRAPGPLALGPGSSCATGSPPSTARSALGTQTGRALGPYSLQAAIAACHARARTWAETDWDAIVALYDALASVAPSPVVELNRAVAVGFADGPAAALLVLDGVADDPRLVRHHLYGAVRGDLLTRLGRHAEAADVLERAAALAPTRHERRPPARARRRRVVVRGRAPRLTRTTCEVEPW